MSSPGYDKGYVVIREGLKEQRDGDEPDFHQMWVEGHDFSQPSAAAAAVA